MSLSWIRSACNLLNTLIGELSNIQFHSKIRIPSFNRNHSQIYSEFIRKFEFIRKLEFIRSFEFIRDFEFIRKFGFIQEFEFIRKFQQLLQKIR